MASSNDLPVLPATAPATAPPTLPELYALFYAQAQLVLADPGADPGADPDADPEADPEADPDANPGPAKVCDFEVILLAGRAISIAMREAENLGDPDAVALCSQVGHMLFVSAHGAPTYAPLPAGLAERIRGIDEAVVAADTPAARIERFHELAFSLVYCVAPAIQHAHYMRGAFSRSALLRRRRRQPVPRGRPAASAN